MKPLKYEDVPIDVYHVPDVPERTLWLAVIDRALIDFALHDNGRAYYTKGKMWRWMYYDTPIPYNLVWICNLLFDDDPVDMANKIRKTAEQLRERSCNGEKIGRTVFRREPNRD